MRYMTNEEYDRYWDELGETRETIARDLTRSQDALILDVACGWGYYTFQLAHSHPTGLVVAVDLVPSAFTNMERKGNDLDAPDNIAPLIADATRLPFKGGSFDHATSFLGMRDIYMTLGSKGVESTVKGLAEVTKTKGRVTLAVTPPDLSETEEERIAIEVEGEVFGARSLPSTFYRDLFSAIDVRLLDIKSYSTCLKMTAKQTKTELRDGLEICKEVYGRDVPDFEEVWQRYGPLIEEHGYGMYSLIRVLVGEKG